MVLAFLTIFFRSLKFRPCRVQQGVETFMKDGLQFVTKPLLQAACPLLPGAALPSLARSIPQSRLRFLLPTATPRGKFSNKGREHTGLEWGGGIIRQVVVCDTGMHPYESHAAESSIFGKLLL